MKLLTAQGERSRQGQQRSGSFLKELRSAHLQAADRGGSTPAERSSCRRPTSRPAADTEAGGASRRAAPVCRRRRRRGRHVEANARASTRMRVPEPLPADVVAGDDVKQLTSFCSDRRIFILQQNFQLM